MKSTIFLAILTLTFAGCTGVPAGAADYGDNVTVTWAAFDPDTDQFLSGGNGLTFVLGSGGSGLGFDFERNLIGALPDTELDFISEDDPSRDYTGRVSIDRLLEQPMIGEVPIASFESQFGAAIEGDEYDFGIYGLRAVTVTADTVTYRYVFEEGQRDPVDFVGATLVSRSNGETLIQELEPMVGATFAISPPTQFNPNTPLGLEPGSYRTIGSEGDQIVYGFSQTGDPTLLGVPVRFEVTISSVSPAPSVAYSEDGFTKRNSPQLLANPAHVTAESGKAESGNSEAPVDESQPHDH